jgi:adenylate cyclase class 1
MNDHYQLSRNFAATCPQRTRHINQIFEQLSIGNSQLAFLLPLLISENQAQLPGYVSEFGGGSIFQYQVTKQAITLAKQFFDVDIKYKSLPTTTLYTGLYTIGSLGSLGQSLKSDWDVWLCLNADVTLEQRLLIEKKCRAIEHWANQISVELHLFLVTENQFKAGVKSGFDKESSGSAQHWLLLDEFYRSAITLAGKPIRWHLSSTESPVDAIDFGHPKSIPAQEYFGAMMWQLYKGIDSPEKSLLKALLLESYFNDFPHTQLLSVQWRQVMHNNEFSDHYYLLLQRITEHLNKLNDHKRLLLVRECFYLKCAPGLSYIKQGMTLKYQQQQLLMLTQQWQFSAKKIKHLDRQARWSPVDNQQHHQALVSALLESYQLMKKMAQHHNVDEALYPQELTILSRKLYSAYQQSDTKINRLAPVKSVKHTNNNLYLRRGINQQKQRVWLLLSQPPVFGKDYIIHQDTHIIKLLTWAVINQLISPTTQIKLPSDNAKYSHKVNRSLAHLAAHFNGGQQATKNALVQSSQIEKVSIVINMLDDATINFDGQAQMMDWLISNIFSIGRQKHSLVSSIDLVYRNSWNEHHALVFNGNNAILELLSHLFTLIRSSSNTPEINVLSVAKQHQTLLRDHVQFLLDECFEIIKKSSKGGIQVKSLVVAGKLYGLFFHRENVEFKVISNAVQLYKTLSQNALTQVPSKQPTASKVKRLIYEHASIGFVQFFLEHKKQGIKVYILDENNHLSSYWQDEQNELELLREIYRFYTFTKEQKNKSQEKLDISFNLPQFNRIKQQTGVIIIEPFDQQAEELF